MSVNRWDYLSDTTILTAGTIIGIPIGLLADDSRFSYNRIVASSIIGSISCTAILRLTWISRVMPIQAFGIGFMITAMPFGILEMVRHYEQIIGNKHGSEGDGLLTIVMVMYAFWGGCAFLTLAFIIQFLNRILINLNVL